MTRSKREIWIVTGNREVGKTRFCLNLAAEARKNGLDIAGIICPPTYEGGQKTAIEIEDLRTSKTFTLAKSRTNEKSGILTDSWVFDPEILAWGNEILRTAAPCNLLIIDELGPLEFKRNEGWQEGLKAIDGGNYQTAVVVIRPELIPFALERWPEANILEIPPQMDHKTERDLQTSILATSLR